MRDIPSLISPSAYHKPGYAFSQDFPIKLVIIKRKKKGDSLMAVPKWNPIFRVSQQGRCSQTPRGRLLPTHKNHGISCIILTLGSKNKNCLLHYHSHLNSPHFTCQINLFAGWLTGRMTCYLGTKPYSTTKMWSNLMAKREVRRYLLMEKLIRHWAWEYECITDYPWAHWNFKQPIPNLFETNFPASVTQNLKPITMSLPPVPTRKLYSWLA